MASLIDDLKNKFIRPNGAIGQLIVIQVAIYLITALIAVVFYLAAKPEVFSSVLEHLYLPSDLKTLMYRPWTLLTYGFFHDLKGVFHILFNMLWLYWMGKIFYFYRQNNKEIWDLFLNGVLFGGLLFILAFNVFPVFTPETGLLLGASAGISAIIIATATLQPDFEIMLFLFGKVKLKWLAIIYIAMDLIFIRGGNAGGHIAHLGGALFGFLYILNIKKYRNIAIPFSKITNLFEPKSSQMKVVYTKKSKRKSKTNLKKSGDHISQEMVDEVLSKISKVGYENLTREEKEILFKASQQK